MNFSFSNLDEYNNENVPPINIRIDLPKGDPQPPPPPTVTVQVQDRSLVIASHALDVLAQNLEEILTPEEKLIRQNQPLKIVPLDIILKNVQVTLEVRDLSFLTNRIDVVVV